MVCDDISRVLPFDFSHFRLDQAVECLHYRAEILASGSKGSENNLILWNIASGAKLHTLKGHSDGVVCVYHDGATLLSGSADCTARVWSISDGSETLVLRGHTSTVTAVCLLDPGTVVSSSLDRTIRFWDISTGEQASQTDIESEALCMSVDTKGHVFVGSKDGSLTVIEAKTGAVVRRIALAHGDWIKAVHVDSKRNLLITASWDRSVRIWNTHDFSVQKTLSNAHSNGILAANFMKDFLVTGAYDTTFKLWKFSPQC